MGRNIQVKLAAEKGTKLQKRSKRKKTENTGRGVEVTQSSKKKLNALNKKRKVEKKDENYSSGHDKTDNDRSDRQVTENEEKEEEVNEKTQLKAQSIVPSKPAAERTPSQALLITNFPSALLKRAENKMKKLDEKSTKENWKVLNKIVLKHLRTSLGLKRDFKIRVKGTALFNRYAFDFQLFISA